MPVKRINPLEQHIDKILVGLAGASLLGVVVYQFVGGGGTINVSGNRVPIESAFGRVRDEALRLKADMNSENPPLPAVPEGGGMLADFDRRFNGPLLPPTVANLPPLAIGPSVLGETRRETAAGDGPINNPALPAPTGVVAAAFMSLIDKAEVEAAPELAKFMPKAEPFDVPAVSVQAMLDGSAIRQALENDPDSGGPIRALPKNWWDGTTVIYRVELVRQERQADGSWGPDTPVAPIPGRFSVAQRLAEGVRPGEQAQQLMREVRENEEAILRPDWFRRPAIAGVDIGDEWIPPFEAGATGGDDLRSLTATAAGLRSRIENVERRLAGPRPGAGGRGEGGGGGRIGAAPRPAPGKGAAENPGDRGARQAQEKNLETLRQQFREVEEKIRAAGGTVAPLPAPAGQGGGRPGAPAVPPPPPDVLSNPSIPLWAHDLDVRRGATYRYQVRVWVSNPIFGRGGLPDSQQELARKAHLVGQSSAWSEPVQVPEEFPMFITSATDRDPNAGVAGRSARATAEVFTFSWGYWRRAQINLETGDTVSGATATLDFDKLKSEVDRITAEHGRPAGGGAGGGGRIGGGAAGGANAPDPTAKLDVAAVVRRVPVSRDVLMLDAITAPDAGGRDRTTLAYLRGPSGQLVARVPDDDRRREDYRRLAASVRNGEDFLKIRLATQLNPEAEQRPVNAPKEKAPPAPAGGGGGGGG
jgi:hypothetical protein